MFLEFAIFLLLTLPYELNPFGTFLNIIFFGITSFIKHFLLTKLVFAVGRCEGELRGRAREPRPRHRGGGQQAAAQGHPHG